MLNALNNSSEVKKKLNSKKQIKLVAKIANTDASRAQLISLPDGFGWNEKQTNINSFDFIFCQLKNALNIK